MKDKKFYDLQHSEVLIFKSMLSEEETIEYIKSRIPIPYDYVVNSNNDYYLKYTRRRLYVFEYSIHCDIMRVNDKYRLSLYYTKDESDWISGLACLLTFLIVGSKLVDELSSLATFLISIGSGLFVAWALEKIIDGGQTQMLKNACESIKRELEACIKLELEP